MKKNDINFDICLDCFFTEKPLIERVAAVSAAGFNYIETWQSDRATLSEINKACDDNGVSLVSIVFSDPGNIACALTTPETHHSFLEHLDRVSDNALSIGCRTGVVCVGNDNKEYSSKQQSVYIIDALEKAAELAENKGFNIIVEALNTRVDHAGYYLDDPYTGFEIIRAVDSFHVKLLFDVYHMQIMSGNLAQCISEHIDLIGHFHIAGVPGRHEIIDNEVNYQYVINKIIESGFKGFIGMEYFPKKDSAESLKEVNRYIMNNCLCSNIYNGKL
jgi:hydroxypyruvate isomerase